MTTLRGFWFRMAALFRSRQIDADLVDELESHLEMHVAENLRAGMTPDEARRRARIALGGMEQIRKEHRAQSRFRWLDEMVKTADSGRATRRHPRPIGVGLAI